MHCLPSLPGPVDIWARREEGMDGQVLWGIRFLSERAQKWVMDNNGADDIEVVKEAWLIVPEEIFEMTLRQLVGTPINVLCDTGDYHA